MFKIGTFSQLTGVTVKALRYYDRVGLLKPASVDQFSGYRYYTVDQIDRLNRILALKDLGLSLDEIRTILHENLSVAKMQGMLRLKQAQLQQHIDEEQARLKRVEARLSLLEQEGVIPAHEVIVRDVPDITVLSYREVLPSPEDIKRLFQRVSLALDEGDVPHTEPWLALYHHGEYREHDLDVEAAIPVDDGAPSSLPLADGNCMQHLVLPAVQVASTICRMETQADVFAANHHLGKWIVDNGYQILDSPCREVYPEAPQVGKPIVFEIQLPITR